MRSVDRHLTEQERDLAAAELARSVPGHPGKTLLDLTFALPSLNRMALALTEALGSGNDVRQVAALGVMRAAQTFDPARGKFATYAVFQIKAALARELAAAGRQCRRVPEGVAVLSLGGGPAAEGDTCIDPPVPEPDATAGRDAARSAWLDREARLLRRQDARAAYVLEARRRGETLHEISEALGISPARVRHTHCRTLAALSRRAAAAAFRLETE